MSTDNTILVTNSKDNAQMLRAAILAKFRENRPWVCIMIENGEFRLTVDGPWGNRFSEDEEKKIIAFAKGFKFPNVTAS